MTLHRNFQGDRNYTFDNDALYTSKNTKAKEGVTIHFICMCRMNHSYFSTGLLTPVHVDSCCFNSNLLPRIGAFSISKTIDKLITRTDELENMIFLLL